MMLYVELVLGPPYLQQITSQDLQVIAWNQALQVIAWNQALDVLFFPIHMYLW